MALFSHLLVLVASDTGLHKVHVGQPILVELLCQIAIGVVGIGIIDITKG